MKKYALAPRKVLIGLALGAVGFAGAVNAQTAGQNSPAVGQNTQPAVQNTQTGNGFANDPRNQQNFIFDPRFPQFNGPRDRLAVDPRFTQGFNQGFNQFGNGFGFDPGFYGPGWGATVSQTPNYFPNGLSASGTVVPQGVGGLPTLGMNVRTGTYDSRRTRVDLSTLYGPGAEVAADQRLRNRRGDVVRRLDDDNVATGSAADPEAGNRAGGGRTTANRTQEGMRTDPLVRGQLTRVMDGKPLSNARVLSVGPAQVELEFNIDGHRSTATVPMSRIFFFGAEGDLRLAAEHPQMVVVGSEVMAPAPRHERVAGSRQTIGTKANKSKK